MSSLSVVIPVYNAEQYLPACLDSLLRQGIDDLEVILVNDGSRDGSRAVMDRYAAAYPGVFLCLEEQNRGPGGARNNGISRCTKEYVTFLDSDDFITDGGYAAILEKMRRDGADIGVFECVWLYPDGREERRTSLPSFLKEKNLRTFVLAHNSGSNKIYKTSVWRDSGLTFPENQWYEDLAVIPALVTVTEKIAWYEDYIYMYRQHDNSITSKNAYSPRCADIVPSCENVYRLLHGRGYEQELEYLMAFQLCYFASFRFLPYGRREEMDRCLSVLRGMYPDWKKNAYYLRRPRALRVYCGLLAGRHYRLAAALNRLKDSAGK